MKSVTNLFMGVVLDISLTQCHRNFRQNYLEGQNVAFSFRADELFLYVSLGFGPLCLRKRRHISEFGSAVKFFTYLAPYFEAETRNIIGNTLFLSK
jgi:hypothetical protein